MRHAALERYRQVAKRGGKVPQSIVELWISIVRSGCVTERKGEEKYCYGRVPQSMAGQRNGIEAY